MKGNGMPRTTFIGGFRKSDVLAYVEQISVGYQNEISALKKQLADARTDRDEAIKARDSAVSESGEAEKLRTGLRVSYEELTSARASLEELRVECDRVKEELESERIARLGAEEKLAAAGADAEAARAGLERVKGELARANSDIDKLRKTVEELNAAADERQRALEARGEELSMLRGSLERAAAVAKKLRSAAEELEVAAKA